MILHFLDAVRILTATAVLAMMLAMATNAQAVAVVNKTADNLKGGDSVKIVFTAPEECPWIWKLTAKTADGWKREKGSACDPCSLCLSGAWN